LRISKKEKLLIMLVSSMMKLTAMTTQKMRLIKTRKVMRKLRHSSMEWIKSLVVRVILRKQIRNRSSSILSLKKLTTVRLRNRMSGLKMANTVMVIENQKRRIRRRTRRKS